MGQLYWQTTGTGKTDLVLLHGWGMNAEVWHDIISRLSVHFRLHMVDLPGYGRSGSDGACSLDEMVEVLQAQMPPQAIWLGWSLGGLVASQMALRYPSRVRRLITVASSPCFTRRDNWPGIKPQTLHQFQMELHDDFQRTVERFLALQTLGSRTAREDIRRMKEVVLAQPIPSLEVLEGGLEILCTIDLRNALCQLGIPFLRIYGQLDALVPHKVAGKLDALWPHSSSVMVKKAAHAPFISHPDLFCQQLILFCLPGVVL